MKENIREFLIITIGVILVAVSVQYFFVPAKITGGGITGLAMVINHYVPSITMGLSMMIMNIILFAIAFLFLGSSFGGKTIYAAFGLSGVMWFIEKFMRPQAVTDDIMLSVIIGTLLLGIGLGITFSQNASTGGTTILAKILNKFFHIEIGKCIQAVDIIVVIAGALTFGISKGLYAVVSVLLNGIIIDKVIEGFDSVKSVMVFSNKCGVIREYIVKDLDRGCTIFEGKGGYTGNNREIIYCVMDRTQLIRLRSYIKRVDKDAFIIVSDAREVLGQGFKNIHNG